MNQKKYMNQKLNSDLLNTSIVFIFSDEDRDKWRWWLSVVDDSDQRWLRWSAMIEVDGGCQRWLRWTMVISDHYGGWCLSKMIEVDGGDRRQTVVIGDDQWKLVLRNVERVFGFSHFLKVRCMCFFIFYTSY